MQGKKNNYIYSLKRLLVPILIAFTYFLLAQNSIIHKAATTDEKYHLIRGVMAIKTGDLRINQHHPYLFNIIPAIPTALNKEVQIPSTKLDEWKYAEKDRLADIFVEINGGLGNFEKTVLNPSRMLMISISSTFLVAYYLIIQKRFSTRVAAVSSLLLAFSPTFLAHSRLVTTDTPAAITIFFASIALYDLTKAERVDFKKIVIFALLGFAAILTKYTALLVTPIWMLCLFIFLFMKYKGSSAKRVLKSAKIIILISIAWVVLLTAAYKFQFKTLQEMIYENQYKVESREGNFDAIKASYGVTVANISQYLYEDFRWPFPQYVNGFTENVLVHNYTGHGTFLIGEFSQHGWWYYFPFAYLVKETVVTVILTAISSLIYIGYKTRETFRLKRFRFPELPMWTIFLPVAIIVALAIQSSINLGVRHILAAFPLIFLLISILISSISLKNRYLDYATGVLLAISIFVTVQVHPNYIEYFNEIIGGPQNGYMYLRDSNLDWNQNKILDRDFVKETQAYGVTEKIEDLVQGNAKFFRIDKDGLYRNPAEAREEVLKLKGLVDAGEVAIIGTIENTGFVLYTDAIKL